MVRSAPRYDPRIDDLVVELDEEGQPIAEICRRVAAAAEELGLTRPSLVHLRTRVRAERDRKEVERLRREDLREVAEEIAGALVLGRVPNAYYLADQIARAGHRERT